jgi:hypothetical protein
LTFVEGADGKDTLAPIRFVLSPHVLAEKKVKGRVIHETEDIVKYCFSRQTPNSSCLFLSA